MTGKDLKHQPYDADLWLLALECSGIAVWDQNFFTGEVFRSKKWNELFGYDDDEIGAGLSEWKKRIHPEDLGRVCDEFNWHARGELHQYISEYRFRCKDGTYKWVLDQGQIVEWNNDGQPARMVGTIKVITPRKQIEDELHSYRRHLEDMVKAHTEELEKYRHNLEAQVSARASELMLVNEKLRKEIIERKHAEEALRRREVLLEAVSQASEILLQPLDWPVCIREVLTQLGEAVQASRVYIFQNHEVDGKLVWDKSHEWYWVADGISPVKHNPELYGIPVNDTVFSRWAKILGQNKILYGHTHQFPDSEKILARLDIASVVVVPIFVKANWWGLIGFDFCYDERTISSGEMDVLRLAAGIFSAAIQRRQTEQDLRRSAEQKTLLLREIHHRVKNNLSIVISLLNMQQRQASPLLQETIREIELRIRSMAIIHEQLYRSVDIDRIPIASYLSDIAITLSSSMGRPGIILKTSLDESSFDIETALPCGLIVNELLTNAYKHAFPENRNGDIHLQFTAEKQQEDTAPRRWRLSVSDNGIGLPSDFSLENSSSLGMHIIRLLCKQLRADLSVSPAGILSTTPGTVFNLVFFERNLGRRG